MRSRIAHVLVAGLLSVALMAYASHIAPPIGLFHDDGIYAVTAKALAEGRGFHIISVPTEPTQSKYPILYPLLLSIVWRVFPGSAEHGDMLRLIGLLSMAWFAVASVYLHRSVTSENSIPMIAAVAIATALNPLVSGTAVMLLSDMPFAAIVVTIWLVHARRRDGPRLTPLAVIMGVLAGMALMTRQVGLAFAVPGLLWAWNAGRAPTLAYLAGLTPFALASGVNAAAAKTVANPLLAYYTGYEARSAVSLIRHPGLAARIVADNVAYAWQALNVFVLPTPLEGAAWFFGALIAIGCMRLYRRCRFASVTVACYLALVLPYPFVPTRYLLPLVPWVVIAAFEGTRTIGHWAASQVRPRNASFVRRIALLPIVLMVITNLAWARWNGLEQHSSRNVRLWLGVATSYRWDGFVETFDWISANTSDTAVLATAYDPMYFLNTGRQGVRPWLHNPETYFYPRGRAEPNIGAATEVFEALDDLHVSYLVVDPLDGFAEGPQAGVLYQALIAKYGRRATLVFQSSDARHRIYRLDPATASGVSLRNKSHPRNTTRYASRLAGGRPPR